MCLLGLALNVVTGRRSVVPAVASLEPTEQRLVTVVKLHGTIHSVKQPGVELAAGEREHVCLSPRAGSKWAGIGNALEAIRPMHSKRLISIALLGWTGAFGCAGETPAPQDGADVPRAAFPLRRRVCEGEREQLVDANGDGRANVRHVFNGEKPTCSELDMNMDGRVDVTRLFDSEGQIAREQHDFDFDGRLDQQGIYEGGVLVRKELDTNFDKLVDTWVWCDGPFVERLERDRLHRGQVDSWEHYEGGLVVAIRYDDNSDGAIERWETFKAGRLTMIALDDNRDGEPDTPRQISLSSSTPVVEPVTCDGNPLPHLESASVQSRNSAASATTAKSSQALESAPAAPDAEGAPTIQDESTVAPEAAPKEGETHGDDGHGHSAPDTGDSENSTASGDAQ